MTSNAKRPIEVPLPLNSHRTPKNREENLAQHIVETAIPGTKLRFNHDQSNSIADFAITRNHEEIGALEVTRSTVAESEELRSLIRKTRFLERKHCRSDWMVQLGDRARINHVRKNVDNYLSKIELLNIDEFCSEISHRIEPIRKIWMELHVDAGWRTKLKQPGIGIYPPPSGGYADPETVCLAVQMEANKPDNLHKLRESVGSERHLFVFIDGLQGPAYVSIRDKELPQSIPRLPPDITHVWAAAEEGHLLYVWRADHKGWQDLTHVINLNTHTRKRQI